MSGHPGPTEWNSEEDYQDPRAWRDTDPEIVSLFGHAAYYQTNDDEAPGMTLQELLGDVE